jgi:N-acetylneuraminate synthase
MTHQGGQPTAVEIGGRRIDPDSPPFVIAEVSANHNGDKDTALAMIDAAADAGADAVKLQTYTADTITMDVQSPDFRIDEGLWAGRYLHELYQQAHTPWNWHPELFARARARGITLFSSPFDETAVDFLDELGAPAYKIASFELTHIPLIRKAAATGKPLIMSTGMAQWEEIAEAVDAARAAGSGGLVLLHCVSGYPTPPEEANLASIQALAERFQLQVGLSDHTLGTAVATTSVALGARIIEKHFILDRATGGPDAPFSLEPSELATLCRDARTAFSAIGQPRPGRTRSESAMVPFRRSIYAARDIAPGEPFDATNVRVIRPGYGLAPRYWDHLMTATAAQNIPRGTAITWDMLS